MGINFDKSESRGLHDVQYTSSRSSRLASRNIFKNCLSRGRTKEMGIEVAVCRTSRHGFIATSKKEKRDKKGRK
jgi:hypothetical protein